METNVPALTLMERDQVFKQKCVMPTLSCLLWQVKEVMMAIVRTKVDN